MKKIISIIILLILLSVILSINSANGEKIYKRLDKDNIDDIISTFKRPDIYHKAIINKATQLLGEIGNEKAVDTLIEALDKEGYNTISIIMLLGKIGSKKAIDPLFKIFREIIENNRKGRENEFLYVKTALSRLLDNNDKQSSDFIKILENENDSIRKNALEWYKKSGDVMLKGRLISDWTKSELLEYIENYETISENKAYIIRVAKGWDYKKEIDQILKEKQYPELILNHKIKNMSEAEKILLFRILDEIIRESTDVKKIINAFIVMHMNGRANLGLYWTPVRTITYESIFGGGQKESYNSYDKFLDRLLLCANANPTTDWEWILERVKVTKYKRLIEDIERIIK